MAQAVILAGIKHCGKSTQGKILAKRLACPFFDTDEIVTQNEKASPRELYLAKGAEAFMQAEAKACDFLANQITEANSRTKPHNEYGISAVIASGGGICNNTRALSVLKQLGSIVFLETPEKAAADRIIQEIVYIDGKMTQVPAYIAKESPQTESDVRRIFSVFFAERCALYRQIADICCCLDDAPKEVNADKIWAVLQDKIMNTAQKINF